MPVKGQFIIWQAVSASPWPVIVGNTFKICDPFFLPFGPPSHGKGQSGGHKCGPAPPAASYDIYFLLFHFM